MADDGAPELSVGFAIDLGRAIESLRQIQVAMDVAEKGVVGGAGRIEQATREMVNSNAAVAGFTTIGNAATREMANVSRATAQAEKSAEGWIRRLEQQNATFGMSRDQIQSMRIAASALAAEQAGLAEAAGRLRAEETLLNQQRARAAAAVEANAQATRSAALAYQMFEAAARRGAEALRQQEMEKRAEETRQAAFAYQMFEARVREGAAALRAEQEVLRQNALAEREQQLRSAAQAYQMFQARVREGAAAMREQEAAERRLAAEAVEVRAALDPMYLAQKRFDDELDRADRLLHAGAISQREYTDEVQRARDALRDNATYFAGSSVEVERFSRNVRGVQPSAGAARASMQNLGFQIQDFATQVVGGTSALRAFAMQAPQAAGALTGFGGVLGRVGGFLAGPWGIALTVATTLAAGFAASLFESGKAAEKAAESKSRLKDVIDRLSGATAVLNRNTRQGMIDDLNAAEAARQLELRKRGLLDALLREQQAKLTSARATEGAQGGTVPGAGLLGQSSGRYEMELRETNKALAANAAAVAKTQTAIISQRGALIRRDVAGATDAVTAATQRYEDTADRLQRQLEGRKITEDQYRDGLLAATRARDAATEAANRGGRAAGAGTRATAGMTAALRDQERASREAEAAARDLQSTYEGLEGRFDASAAAGRQFSKDLADIRRLQSAGKIDQNTADAWGFEAAREAAAKVATAVQEVSLEVDELPKNASLDFSVEGLDAFRDLRTDFDLIARGASEAGRGMADAFGRAGQAAGSVVAIFADYRAEQDRIRTAVTTRNLSERQGMLETSRLQVAAFGDMTAAAQGFFNEKSRGYAALQAAEKVYRAFEFAMSVRAMVQDVSETISSVANSGARAAAAGAEGVANQSRLPFPFNLAAMAATAAALVAAGVTIFSGGSRGSNAQPTNTGTGTVLGDPTAKSESIKRSIDALREVDLVTSVYAREMASSLRSIENAIGGVAAQVVRAGDVNASAGITEGFQKNLIGSVLGKIPLIGGILGGLFGSKTEVTGSGLFANAQSLGSILNRGFDASYYSDVKKTSSFLGIKTGTKTSTQYTGASGELEGQFTLILRQFNDAITAAAAPLGQSAAAFQDRLNGFVLNIGKIDLKGLTGEQIEEKLGAVFGAAADNMANAAFPGLARFQRAGEGAFETLTRVASTVEAVTTALDLLGGSSRNLGIDIKVALADQFDSVSDFTSAVSAYAEAFYTQEERQAAQAAQMNRVFASLGLTMPGSLAAFRQLVEAQDLTTAAGRSTYAALLNLAPAFADLQKAMQGAKSAADVLAERQDLERQLLELAGDTAAIRALDLAKLDASNRALQEQVWAVQDAQAAAKAADELRQAWTSVGDSIMDEVNRIRGLTEVDTGGGFATLIGRFNAATESARAGDQDAAKTLPGLSQALLSAAANAATSRQELDRIQAQTASSLEETYRAISAFSGAAPGTSTAALLTAAMAQAAAAPGAANDSQAVAMDELRQEITDVLRSQLAQMADVASSNRKIATKFDDVTADSGGDAISVRAA